MKQLKRLALLCAAACVFASCSDNTPKQVSIGSETIELTAPSNFTSMTVTSGTYTFTNVTTGVATEIAYPLPTGASVEEGLYNVKFVGEAECVVDLSKADDAASQSSVTVKMQGAQTNVVVKADGSFKLTLALSVVPESSNDFVISEIYYVGSAYAPDASGKQKQYNGDAYIKITNNSDTVLYADGLAFVESAFTTSTKNDYTPMIRDSAITVDAVFVIPGSGKQYPVQPGESIVICDNAQNHKEADPSFMDLSGADFEWFTNSTNANYPDIDNPAVPNLETYYCYTATIFVMNKQGTKAYALVRMPQGMTKDRYLNEYTYSAYYTNILGKPTTPKTYYKIPNDWVVDAVEMRGYKYEFAWSVFDPSLDISYTYCGDLNAGTINYGTAVRRKVAYTNDEGRDVLQDTNNSAEDFERNVTPSMQ